MQLGLEVGGLFVVEGQNIVKLQLKHFELCFAHIVETESAHQLAHQSNCVDADKGDFVT